MNKKRQKISDKDKKDWDNFIKSSNEIFDKDESFSPLKSQNTFKYDFHGYSLHAANEKIDQLIQDCIEKGVYKILVITGKGLHSKTEKNVFASNELSKLRYSLPHYIKTKSKNSKNVKSISEVSHKDGDSGAFELKLKL